MPVIFQQQINDHTRLGVWRIEETEEFFKGNVPQHRDVTHPRKRLQHLAGRFLLQFLFPDFPYELIQIADTRKPFLLDERYHFSISHCGDYAAAIVSKTHRVGVDVEIPTEKVLKITKRFLSDEEIQIFNIQHSIFNVQVGKSDDLRLPTTDYRLPTLLWSAKEAVFKWFGDGAVDFKEHIHLKKIHHGDQTIECFFSKNNSALKIYFRQFDYLNLTWIVT